MTYQTIAIAVLAIAYLAVRYFNSTDVPKISGIPEILGWPIFGSLLELGSAHASVAGGWAKKYGPVFQARLGNKRIIFANTFDSVRELWIKNQSALISRPTLHTFHTVVSSSQGFTIGTSPWDESCKVRRKAAATALNKPSVASYMPIIDLESTVSIKEIFTNSKDGTIEVDPCAYFQRFALNTSLTLNYGFRIEGNINDSLLNEITTVERLVSNFRSTSNNWADYIPLMRPFTSLGSGPTDARKRRDVYMNKLLGMLKQKIADGTDKPCITGNILKDPEAKLNDAEINSIGLTMVSAGLDTVPGNLIMALAYLGSPEGQAMQERGNREIMEAYPDGDAWEKCLIEEKVPFITAFVKETLRFWTVIPICLPRVSVKDIEWQGATIPAGTTFYMNAYAADYDVEHYKEPFQFNPDRFLGDKSEEVAGTAHYGYGAGSRMCAGSHLANRELYTCFLRIMLAFNITECANQADRPFLDALECNNIPTSLTMDPKPFKLNFRCRGGEEGKRKLERWIAESEERTKDL